MTEHEISVCPCENKIKTVFFKLKKGHWVCCQKCNHHSGVWATKSASVENWNALCDNITKGKKYDALEKEFKACKTLEKIWRALAEVPSGEAEAYDLFSEAVKLLRDQKELWGFVEVELNALDDYNARVRHMQLHDPIGRIDKFFTKPEVTEVLKEQGE